jgi:hypothetical protein
MQRESSHDVLKDPEGNQTKADERWAKLQPPISRSFVYRGGSMIFVYRGEFLDLKGTIISFLNSSCWRDLYETALFETDRSILPERIADAEKAIVARARELFSMTTDYTEEVQAIEDALYALRALQTYLGLKSAGD